MKPSDEIAIVGATGVVGREVLGAFEERDHPAEHLTVLASERNEAVELEYGGEGLGLEKPGPDSFRGMKAVVLATPAEVSEKLAPMAQAAGAWVVDLSEAFRDDPNVPLVLPSVNLAAAHPKKGRIVRTPSPVSAALVTILEPLRKTFGVAEVFVTALLGASSAGMPGVTELETETAGLLSGRDAEPERFPHRLAFNVIPQVGVLQGPWTREELRWRDEAARLWAGQPDLPVISGTALQVPIFYGHTLTLSVHLRANPSEDALRAALKGGAGLKVLDSPEERVYPMPMLVTADPSVHVGRVRSVEGAPGWFQLVGGIDNAGRGAALNAVEIVESLLAG